MASLDRYVALEHPPKKKGDSSKPRDLVDAQDCYVLESMTSPPDDKITRTAWNKQLESLRKMAVPYFEESPCSYWMLVVLVLLSLVNSGVRIFFSYISNYFWTALAEKEIGTFYKIMQLFFVSLVILAPINVFYRYYRQKLVIHWRDWMTERTLQLYYTHRSYYSLETQMANNHDSSNDSEGSSQKMDNPDQRIAEDVRNYTQFSITFFLILVSSVLDMIGFSVVLFLIHPPLLLAIVAFASTGTIATWFIGRCLIWLNFERLQKEADFRFSLVRTRENAESIAFYSGEAMEGQNVNRKFRKAIDNMHEINTAQRNLEYFTTIYSYLTWILPVLVMAPEFFMGKIQLGVLQQSAVAFNHVLEDVSIVVDQFDDLSEFAAAIDRLAQFYRTIWTLDPHVDQDEPQHVFPPMMEHLQGSTTTSKEGSDVSSNTDIIELVQQQDQSSSSFASAQNALTISSLTILTPDQKRTLIQNLNLTLPWGQNLLITGTSGVGKSSLLRSIAGLWTAGSGSIERPSNKDVLFLPQRPYCTLGTLRDQLTYPRVEAIGGDSTELLNVLQAIGAYDTAQRAGGGDALAGLDAVSDWSNTLSLGEQQKLSIARVLVNKPRLVILDEATSAVDEESEKKLYNLLREVTVHDGKKMTFISVGHRSSLQAHHDMQLALQGGESYSLTPIKII